MTKVLLADYPTMCICSIERIDNPMVRAAYTERRDELRTLRGDDKIHERTLFHGTKASLIDAITLKGFKVALNRVSAYGLGTYFATSACMSKMYTDVASQSDMSYIFVCKVLVGVCTTNHHAGALDTTRYDNSTNISQTIFTSPTDDGAYPEYLVAFYKRG